MATKRGFAAMSPEKRREIARKGGQASRGGGRRRSNAAM
jgi:general stress protein YciG